MNKRYAVCLPRCADERPPLTTLVGMCHGSRLPSCAADCFLHQVLTWRKSLGFRTTKSPLAERARPKAALNEIRPRPDRLLTHLSRQQAVLTQNLDPGANMPVSQQIRHDLCLERRRER